MHLEPGPSEKDEAILAKKRERFEADLADLHKGLSKPRSTKKYDKVVERLGRLRERYALVNHHYDITVTKAPDGKARAVTWKRNAAYDAQIPVRAIMSCAPATSGALRIRFAPTGD